MSATPDVMLGGFEYTLPMKTGEINGNERLPIVVTAGVAAAELDLRNLIGQSQGAWISFQVFDGGPLYIGMNKAATSATSLTAGNTSLGRRVAVTDGEVHFWVEHAFPFCEIIADVASTHIQYRRSNSNRSNRDNAVAIGH